MTEHSEPERGGQPEQPVAPSSWPARLGQIVTFCVAVAGMAFLGVVHPDAPALAEVLAFCLAVIVLLRLPDIAKLKALGVEVETRGLVSRILDRQVARGDAASPAKLHEAATSAPPERTLEPSPASSDVKGADPWSPGHTYWLGRNIMFAAFALAQGNVSAALLEWNHAIGHAQRLPLDSAYAARLRELQDYDLLNPRQRVAAIQALLDLSSHLGRLVAARDPRFDDRELVGRARSETRSAGG